MKSIAIISASVRQGRKSHRVALYLKHLIEEKQIGIVQMLDLMEYNFPIFDERLINQKAPLDKTLDFVSKFKLCDGIIIVTPEYNGGYPGALKNVIDVLVEEWKHKPVGLSTVSGGQFGGVQSITSLQFNLWKIIAFVSTTPFIVANIDKTFNEKGIPIFKEETEKRALAFLDELIWCIQRI